jgi:hypothetical protein
VRIRNGSCIDGGLRRRLCGIMAVTDRIMHNETVDTRCELRSRNVKPVALAHIFKLGRCDGQVCLENE